jgi:predicted  nucleic acid-binding Zn-ribbon protein
MKRITIFIFILASVNAFAQTETLTKEDLAKELQPLKANIQTLQKENGSLKSEISNLNTKLLNANKSIDSLRTLMKENSSAISQTANQLGIQITTTEQTAIKRIDEVGQSLSTNSLYGIIGVLSAILLSGALYWLLSKRQQTDKNQLSNMISNTKSDLIQESAKLDIQLIDLIEKQLKVADKLNATEPTIDHTFHKNSANELQRIANYVNTLAPESQEAIALKGSLGRLRNYFVASNYEITDFTGKDYDERIPMKVKETFFDETLPKGSEVISRTLKPQIKYKGKVIQEAEVSTKYNN